LRFAWRETRMFAGWTPYFSARRVTIGFFWSGEPSEPSGE
jgi:hypothetical protein